jgi:hypothetical protein
MSIRNNPLVKHLVGGGVEVYKQYSYPVFHIFQANTLNVCF